MSNQFMDAFFNRHPVFTIREFDDFLAQRHSRRSGHALIPNAREFNPNTRQALLRHHLQQGHLLHVRRGLYAVVRPGDLPATASPDSFLLAARLTPDAVLAYHSALSLHGLAHSLREEQVCLTRQHLTRPLCFRNVLYRAVRPPAALPASEQLNFGVETQERQGLSVRVTGLERTLVDVLDRPTLAGGWGEVWRVWADLEVALDFGLLLDYAGCLKNATTAAKVGYALDAHRERLAVPAAALDALHQLAPPQPHPVERGRREPSRLVRAWNLLVPAGEGEDWNGGDF